MKNLFRMMLFMPLCHTLKFTHIIMKNRKAVICQHNTSSTGTIILRPPPLMVCVCVFLFKSYCDREEGQKGAGDKCFTVLLSITSSLSASTTSAKKGNGIVFLLHRILASVVFPVLFHFVIY